MLLIEADIVNYVPLSFKGVVQEADTNRPIGRAFLYVVNDNVHVSTNKEGLFGFHTWQSFPLTIVAEHPDYEQKQIVVSDPQSQIIIDLKHKKSCI